MRRLAEKVVIVAQICVSLVFAIAVLLNSTNAFYNENNNYYNNQAQYDGAFTSLIAVLFAVHVGLSAYLIYVNFSERENLRRVLLFCDSESATRTTVKVLRKVVNECSKQTEGITVKKIRVRPDDKQGFAVNLKVAVNADNVAQVVDKFRCLLCDAFLNALGLTFNSVNFEVVRLNTKYIPTVSKAEEQAEQLEQQREITSEIYNEPLDNDVNLDCALSDKETTSHERQNEEE